MIAGFGGSLESAVVAMYSDHPSPSFKDKLGFASRRMALRLYCCGIAPEDYVGRDVLDAGCGTGEYACWLASRGAHVTGIDLSEGSLREAREYANGMGIEGIAFEKRSVLQTGYPDASFDFVYCTGVLHHTPDPFGGFAELCRVLRPGGKILISLYNSLGFLPRELRRRIAGTLGGEDLDQRVLWGQRLFPLTARKLLEGERNDRRSALYDYFAIPHESLHTAGQVLGWFDHMALQYVGSFPPLGLGDYPAMFASRGYGSVENRFRSSLGRMIGSLGISPHMRRQRPGWVSRVIVQAIWLARGIGVFAMAGRRPVALGGQ